MSLLIARRATVVALSVSMHLLVFVALASLSSAGEPSRSPVEQAARLSLRLLAASFDEGRSVPIAPSVAATTTNRAEPPNVDTRPVATQAVAAAPRSASASAVVESQLARSEASNHDATSTPYDVPPIPRTGFAIGDDTALNPFAIPGKWSARIELTVDKGGVITEWQLLEATTTRDFALRSLQGLERTEMLPATLGGSAVGARYSVELTFGD